MSFKPIGDRLRAMYPKLAPVPDWKVPAPKQIVITISGPQSLLIASHMWKSLGEASASLMEHYPDNAVTLSSNAEGK